MAQDYVNFSVLLVDNASQDDTRAQVSRRFPDVQIIANSRNLGFAGGYNVGLRQALRQGFELVFLINNDTLLAPSCLTELVAEAAIACDIGLVTAKIYYANDQQRIWSVGNQLHSSTLEVTGGGDKQLDSGQWEVSQDVDFAPLCGVLIKRTLLNRVGLFDEDFFLYYEDMDFCRRARLAGFRLRLAPAARMWHVVSSSSGGENSPAVRYWKAQSSARYFRKHARGWRMLVVVPHRLGSAVKTTLQLLGKRQIRTLAAYWLGLAIGWTTGRATMPPPSWVLSSKA